MTRVRIPCSDGASDNDTLTLQLILSSNNIIHNNNNDDDDNGKHITFQTGNAVCKQIPSVLQLRIWCLIWKDTKNTLRRWIIQSISAYFSSLFCFNSSSSPTVSSQLQNCHGNKQPFLLCDLIRVLHPRQIKYGPTLKMQWAWQHFKACLACRSPFLQFFLSFLFFPLAHLE